MIVALVGPTASGKTELAMAAAVGSGAEIVGADSRQVYRRLDVGSAKPTPAQRAAVPHHLIDVVEPDEPFDCARFRALALDAIEAIAARGRRVLVVGGTGLYVKVLRHGLFAGPPRDPALRARLVAADEAEPGALHRRLAGVDADAAARLHPHDRVRLVRALEVWELTGRPISAWQREHGFGGGVEMHVVGVDVPRAELHRRIDDRCRAMVEGGLVEEVRGLFDAGLDPALPSLQGPGYAEIGAFVRGLCTLDEAVERMAQSTRRLAKRQRTWFRQHTPDVVLPPDPGRFIEECERAWNRG